MLKQRKGALLILAFLILTPITGVYLSKKRTETTSFNMSDSIVPDQTAVTVTGWFTTVRNGEPHYTLTDDRGEEYELTIDEKKLENLGGPLHLDRKRITVRGALQSQQPKRILVSSIIVWNDGMEQQ